MKANLWNFLTFIPKWTATTPADIELVYVDDAGVESREMVPNALKLIENQGGTEDEFIETLTKGTVVEAVAEGDLAEALTE